MAQDLIVEFVDNSLMVKTQDGKTLLNQPFATDGNQVPWTSESEALEWWDSVKDSAYIQEFINTLISIDTTSGNI